MRPLDDYIKKQLDEHIRQIENIFSADVMAMIGPILPGLDLRVREAVERIPDKKKALCIILETEGGVVEVVERIVETIRYHYAEVIFVVPNAAMSAGTVFVMSGDRILMDYFSRLGPIDPQIVKDNRLVPALSYLIQFERLIQKAADGNLTSAEYALLSKLDLGELYQYEQARELTKELLIKWLTNYKFKNWKTTETRKKEVTDDMKKDRANAIAILLSKHDQWHSHGRGINMQTLSEDLKLKIEDFSKIEGVEKAIREYFDLLRDYLIREQWVSFVHTRGYF